MGRGAAPIPIVPRYTAPIHGFKDADGYWARSSSKLWLELIQVPTLLSNARNDRLLPVSALPRNADVSASVTLAFPDLGGHVGFVAGSFPGSLDWVSQRIMRFFIAT
jgi:predicted alpha/beta-fold hydrolase